MLGWRRVVLAAAVCGASVFAGAQVAAKPEAAAKYQYEVASIKPHDKAQEGMRWMMNADSVEINGGDIENIIRSAYDLDFKEDVTGVPSDVKKITWDVKAKCDPETAAALKKLSPEDRRAASEEMLRALLAERFHLKAHLETKEAPVYLLTVAKGGAKIKPADDTKERTDAPKGPDGHPMKGGYFMFGDGMIRAAGVPVSTLSRSLQGQVDRKVIDRTGLSGKYDFDLKFNTGSGGKEGGQDDNLPSLPTALEEQLGLHLEASRGPVNMVVVDHITLPSEN